MYGKLVNGQLHYPPQDLICDDGKVILDFGSNETLLEQMGYKSIIKDIPTYNSTTQYLTIGGYTESDTEITVNYIVVNITADPKEEIVKQIKELQDENDMLKECILEMSEVVYGG